MDDAEPIIIYVDAKIINRDSTTEPKRTFVAYVTADGKEGESEEIKSDDAAETDAAELYAIDFAIRRLKDRHEKFVLLCDNESVVLVLRQPAPKFRKRTRQMMRNVWEELHAITNFEVRQFPINQADRFLNAKWREIKGKN